MNYQEWSTSVDARLMQVQAKQQEMIELFREQERLRGMKPMRWVASNITAAATITIGTTGADAVPVESGFVWDLRIIAGKLSASDSVAVYIGDNVTGGRLIGYVAAPGAAPGQNVFVLALGKSSCILNAGESLTLATSGTGLISAVNINAWSAPGAEVGKLF